MGETGTEPLVRRDDEGPVTTLTLNRADKLNALLPDSFVELRAHLDAIAASDDVRVVVLQGAGRSFCAGNDLAGIAAGAKPPTPQFIPETIDALEALPVPTVARIHGHCFTGGLELALGCDLLVAAASAQLGDTHGQWGLVPVWGMSVRLPERVGRSKAKELSFTARRIDGREAERIGLVDRCAEDDQLDATVGALVEELVRASGGTQRRMKKLIDGHLRTPRQEALVHERSLPYGLPEDMQERMARSSGPKR